MKIISPSASIVSMENEPDMLKKIEAAGRTCYKSEELITEDSAGSFVQRILKSGHHSVIEHAAATVRFVCDRGVSHEIVRHRLASYSQESTRYANYSKDKFGNEITVIRPCFWKEDSKEYKIWMKSMQQAEQAYLTLLAKGASAQEARSVLPNSLKTELIVTCNVREWRHIFELRCSPAAHPQMREIMLLLLIQMFTKAPTLFDDLYTQFKPIINCI